MHIKRAIFINFGPHRHLELDFEQGLVGVFGRNGSGKSHVTDGMYACLTGDFSRFDGVKTDCICDLAGDKEESSITLVAEHEGTGFELTRMLRPNKQILRIQGEAVSITKANEIQEALEERLGVDRRLIDRYVFVGQWQMFSFLADTPGERAKAYQHLCGTERAQEICDAAAKMLEDPALRVTVDDNSDELRTRLGPLQQEIETATAGHAQATARLLSKENLVKARKIIARRERHDEMAAERPAAAAKLTSRQEKAVKASRRRKKAKQAREEAAALVKSLRPGYEQGSAALKAFDQYEKQRRRLDKLKQDRQALEQEHRAEPELFAQDGKCEQFQEQLRAAQQKHGQLMSQMRG
ncbi:MAG: AAA family ATPase, partial [Dehalococcoidia bacterium]